MFSWDPFCSKRVETTLESHEQGVENDLHMEVSVVIVITPIAGWFMMENPIKIFDLGVPIVGENLRDVWRLFHIYGGLINLMKGACTSPIC